MKHRQSGKPQKSSRSDRSSGSDRPDRGGPKRGTGNRHGSGGSSERSGGYNRGEGSERSSGYSRGGNSERGGGYKRGAGSERSSGYNRGAGSERSSGYKHGGGSERSGGGYQRGGSSERSSGYNRGGSSERSGGYKRGTGSERSGGGEYGRSRGPERGSNYKRDDRPARGGDSRRGDSQTRSRGPERGGDSKRNRGPERGGPGGGKDRYATRRPESAEAYEDSAAAFFAEPEEQIADDRALLYGRRPIEAFLERLAAEPALADNVETLWLGDNFPEENAGALRKALRRAEQRVIPRRELDQKYPGIHHQGVVLAFRRGSSPGNPADGADWRKFVSQKTGLLVLLDRIQDPQNLGSIVRSAEALGARAIFLTGQGASTNDTVHRVSSGASLRLPIFEIANLHRLVQQLKSDGYWICAAADPDSIESTTGSQLACTHDELDKLPAAKELALIIGNEGAGIKPLVLRESDYVISITMSGQTPSLNAGVATGILLDRLIHRSDV